MLAVILNILLWLVTGFLLLRYGFQIWEWVILAPVAAGTGIVAHFALVFVLIRLLPADVSGWLASGLLLFLGVTLWYRNRHQVQPLTLGVSRQTAVVLFMLWMLTGLVFAAVRPKERHDEFDHDPRATMVAQAGQPFRLSSGSYIEPDKCQQAHYAEGLMVGVLFSQSHIFDLLTLFDIRIIYNAWAATGLCFVFLWLLLKRQRVAWAVVGTFLFLTIGAPNWLTLAHRVPAIEQHIPDTAFFEVSREEAARVATPAEFIENPQRWIAYPRTDVVSFVWYLTSPNPSSFWVIGFLILLGWYALRQKHYAWYWYAGLGVLTGLSAAIYITGLILIGPIIGFDLLWNVIKNRRTPRYALQALLAFSLTAMLFVIFEGGTITDALLCPTTPGSYNQNYNAGWVTLLEPFSYNNWVYAPDKAYLYNPADWNNFFIAWGIGLFLAPVMLVYSLIKKQRDMIVIMLSSVISLLMPFLIFIENVGENMARIPTLAIWLAGGVSIFLLSALWRQKWFLLNKLLVIAIILVMSLSTVGNVIQFVLRPRENSHVMSPIDYEVQGEWFDRLDVYDEAVFDPHVFHYIWATKSIGVARSITVFGTFSRMNGHTAMTVREYGPESWEPWGETGLPGYLTQAGYTHLYLDERSFEDRVDTLAMRMFNPAYYQLLQTWFDPEARQIRQLFKIVGDETTDEAPVTRDALFATIAPTLYAAAPAQEVEYTLYTPDARGFSGLLSYLWNAEYRQGDQTFVNEIFKFQTFNDVALKLETAAQQEALARWQLVFLPGDLQMAGLDHVWLTQESIDALDPYIVENILRAPYYELSDTIVIGGVEVYQYTAISDASMATYGLSAEDFAALQDYELPVAFEEDTRILNPTTRSLLYGRFARYSIAAATSIYREEGERETTLGIINVLSRLVDLEEADLTSEQQLALDEWQKTRDPLDLAAAGFDYVIFDRFWLDTLPAEEQAMMLNEENYTPVPGWEFQFFDELHHLYRVKQ